MSSAQRLVDLVDSVDAPAELSADTERDLLRRFIARVEEVYDERFRLQYGPEDVVQRLAESYHFVRVRKRNEILVRARPLEASQGADREPSTLVEVIVEDRPFIVDTVMQFLEFTGLAVLSNLFLTMPVRRGRQGIIKSLEEQERVGRETFACFEIKGALEADFCATVEESIRRRLEVGRSVVEDFKRMKTAMRSIARALKRLRESVPADQLEAIQDTRTLVDWLLDENFLLMGVSFFPAGSEPSPEIERDLGYAEHREEDLDRVREMVRRMEGSEQWVIAYKSQEESMIHRSGKIDCFLFRSFDENQQHDGYYQLRGLFTFKAIQTPGGQIPLVRRKLDRLIRATRHKPGSVRYKSFATAFNSIPVEFLFEAPDQEVDTIVRTIITAEKSKELHTHLVVDSENRKGLYFLVIPRHGYSEDLRTRIGDLLIEVIGATYSDSRVYFGKTESVLLSFFFTASTHFREFSSTDLDEQVRSLAGTWEERFAKALVREFGDVQARAYLERYRHAFPGEYRLLHAPSEAVVDVQNLEKIRDPQGRKVTFAVMVNERDRIQRTARLRIYLRKYVYLSTILPILDNFGLQVVDQAVVRVGIAGGRELFLETFRVAGVDDDNDLLARRDDLLEALEVVFEHRVANDTMNRLVLAARLNWRDVDMLRAYTNYLRQLHAVHNKGFMSNSLRQNATVTRLLVEYYHARFDPSQDWTREEREAELEKVHDRIVVALRDVPSSGQEDFFRLLLNVFSCTLRTSRYQTKDSSEHRLSFKIDSRALILGSEPRPWREIYVHHCNMEGIHLRGGKLARGGIRWSDRVSDYREEILGLMRTQMVKNVLIVPVGAKGGFIVRRPAPQPETRRQQADKMYRVFIEGLLDVTDNIVDGEVAAPENVIAYDGDDNYLVVAADKGTAHLSDTANAISVSRDFWLGDAFASGGSNGYDHKGLGITARGAWEGVKRHFREMGLDPAEDQFTVVGIGDMAGDVFGNGMLCSNKIRLLAAFNHQHIFIDPNPDPQRSYDERERLFFLRRSSWTDYRVEHLSEGGGIYERHAKYLRLEPQAKELLGITEDEVRPHLVIQAILRLQVDLLWNGGIGTYIKAASEDNRDVGDFANEDVRVNAKNVRAAIVGEGGNLGITQAGRVEYALAGGRINSDFVDNSGGVDCSDHEVNLKILFAPAVAAGLMPMDERNHVLEMLTDEVCRSVYENSNNQGLMLSLDLLRSRRDLFSFERLINVLEDRKHIHRDRDCLPHLDQMASRMSRGEGLVRPELALLCAVAKMDITRSFLKLDPSRLPKLDEYLGSYFPARLEGDYGQLIKNHLLAHELSITVLANHIVSHAGATFLFEVERETGAQLDRIVRAYLLIDELFQCSEMKNVLLELEGRIDAAALYEAILSVEEGARRAVIWTLNGSDRLEAIHKQRDHYRGLMDEYGGLLPGCLPNDEQDRYQAVIDSFDRAGLGPELPIRLAQFGYLTAGLGIVDLAFRSGADLSDLARLYFRAAAYSEILPLVRKCDDAKFTGRWDSLAVRIVRNTMLDSLGHLTGRLIDSVGSGSGEPWVTEAMSILKKDPVIDQLRTEMRKLGTDEELSVASLQVMSIRLERVFG